MKGSTKSAILELLESNREKSLSGEAIAEKLGISRNSVWKGINELRLDGYNIEAVTNKGYRISEDTDIISAEGIKPYLNEKTREIIKNICVFKTLDSTNTKAKEAALAGAEHGTVIIADNQTGGRGRFSRSFFSPAGCGIYMSFILYADRLPFKNTTTITAHTANTVCDALEKTVGVFPKIKWVNDIYLGNKKICGILSEGIFNFETSTAGWVIVGLGVNVYTPKNGYPAELESIIASVCGDKKPNGGRCRIAAEIINRFFEMSGTDSDVFSAYKTRLFMLGREITVKNGSSVYKAVAEDIDDAGRLIVRKCDGSKEILLSGEISVKL